jgi:hypothetical protein
MEEGKMSLFQFLASDKILEEIKNPYIELLSVNEAIKRNIELDDFVLNDSKINRDEKIIMSCDSEEHLDELEIKYDMYYSSECAEKYSEKQFFSEMQWRYTEGRAKRLYDYIITQLRIAEEIEIWSIWLDDQESANIRRINITEFSISDLDFLYKSNGFEKPECLVVSI